MKTKNIIALTLFAVVMFGIYKFREGIEAEQVRVHGGVALPDISDKRTGEQIKQDRIKDARAAAEASLLSRITNTTGYRRHTGFSVSCYDPQPTNWTAIVTVETLNRYGGVESEFRSYAFNDQKNWLLVRALRF